ncbi:josephin-1 [Agrilus planipennis]|uniref:Josephin-2 n=1 Tax=Agrilus planipennis TaxID=224129 RepID=A0A1W4WWH9_AGRPL|nr:josephin-1 [Agrilus planipennis]
MHSNENCPEVYHEKQVKELCALHALNNLFQMKDYFSKVDFDNICYSLSPNVWINPHRSIFGLGNYDVNVIMKALQTKGYEAIWFDRRKDPSCLIHSNIFGYILNIPTDLKFGLITLPVYRRHWIAIRKVHNVFYNLDSKLQTPKVIGLESDLNKFLKKELENEDNQLFVVVTNEVGEKQSWCN